jgi:hypothetical protein
VAVSDYLSVLRSLRDFLVVLSQWLEEEQAYWVLAVQNPAVDRNVDVGLVC